MSIKEEILEEFFKNLREDKDFPDSLIEPIGELITKEEIPLKDKVYDLISKECEQHEED